MLKSEIKATEKINAVTLQLRKFCGLKRKNREQDLEFKKKNICKSENEVAIGYLLFTSGSGMEEDCSEPVHLSYLNQPLQILPGLC